jgi:SanA protein
MTRIYRLLKYLLAAIVVTAVGFNFWITSSTSGQVFDNINEVPEKDIALILGTSKRMVGGADNQFFYKRIEAAADLYHNGKVKHILVSGDNRTIYYNEPKDMHKALLDLNVPDSAITQDFAGLRTFDSVVRCNEIFGQKKVAIITQEFHTYRALFIANYNDMEAIAFAADFPEHEGATKTVMREYLARVKAVLDIYIFKTEPTHLGEKEEINLN